MSIHLDCTACMMSDHTNHDPSHVGLPGVIGGHHCECEGDCKERNAAAFARLMGDVLQDIPTLREMALLQQIERLEAEVKELRVHFKATYTATCGCRKWKESHPPMEVKAALVEHQRKAKHTKLGSSIVKDPPPPEPDPDVIVLGDPGMGAPHAGGGDIVRG